MLGRRTGVQRVLLGLLCVSMLSQTSAMAQRRSGPLQWRRAPQVCPPTQMPYCPPTSTAPYEVSPAPSAPVEDGTIPAPAPLTDPDAPKDPNAAPVPPAASDVQPSPAQNAINNQPNVAQPQMNNALANVGDTGSRGSRAPSMIGDFFGTSGTPFLPVGGVLTLPTGIIPGGESNILGNLGSAPGGNVGRLKLAENANLIPSDRVFVNYSYFNDVNLYGGFDVQRVTPGFEKTFADGNMSVELRFPFADTASSNFNLDAGPTPANASEFGNMSVWWKALLYSDRDWAISSGLGLTLPTADDYVVTGQGATLAVENNAVHYLPFIGARYTPCGDWFAQGMIQLDIDGNGNDVYAGATGAEQFAGVARDNTFLFIDASVGYWAYRNRCCNATIQGIAPILELHHNTTLNDGNAIAAIGLPSPGGTSVTNVVVGVTTQMKDNKWLTLGYTTPIGQDRQFDGELRLLFNWAPGNTNNGGFRGTF